MAADEGSDLLGNGEGEHEVVAGELALHLALEPLLALEILAGGRAAVAARAKHDMGLPALLALVDGHSTVLGPTADNRVNDLSVLLRDGLAESLEVFGSEALEDLADGAHLRAPP